MIRGLIVALALLPGIAQAQWGGGFVPKSVFGPPPPATCMRGAAFVDGCPAAPAGAAQLPTLLNSYAARTPWNVAGVDYRTGPPTGTVLADPATISQAGVTVNTGTHTVTVSGSGVTLSGYDFGLANGWTVNVNGANDTVQNSHFKVGSNHGALGITLNVNAAASNFSFLANEVDGNNIPVTVQQGFTLGFSNTGTLTIQYNYLHNSGGDMVEIQDGTWTNQMIRYNLFRDIGYKTDHSDTVQWCGSSIAAGDMAFNTVYQSQTGLSGEGLLVLNSECGPPVISATSNIRNVTVRNNTLLSLVNDNFITGQTITQDAGTALGDHNATYNNYTDPTGVYAFTGSPWFGLSGFNTAANAALGNPAALHDLIDMRTSNTKIPVPTASARQGGYLVYPDINSYSPGLSDIFSITPSPASGNRTTGQTVTFTLAMDAPTTVSGTPSIALNSGGSAVYTSGSGTKSLTFTYTVGGGDVAATLAVTAVSGTMKDNVGNVTLLSPLTNLGLSFAGLSVNSGGSTLAFTALTGAAINSTTPGSGTYTGSAPSGLTNAVYGAACTGASTVSGFSASGGTWHATFTTPVAGCVGTLTVTGTGANTATATSPSATFTGASSCPDNDGSSGASAGSPQLPNLLSGYAATINGVHGLGCLVAGVDYHVGLPVGQSLVVPNAGNIPAGTSISGNIISINANNVTFQGFDMTGKSLQSSGVISGTIIQKNNFVVNACVAPPIWLTEVSGTTTIQYNSFDGGGALCGLDDNPGQGYSDGSAADVYVANIDAGATLTYQYNYQANANSDDVDVAGPGSGNALFFDQFNVFNAQGWGGHPDGIQFCGGNFSAPTIRHNTFIQPQSLVGAIDTQPFHVEAQCAPAGHIANALVAFNTMVLPASTNCVGGNFPGGCTANSVISCKNDNPPSSSNSGFQGYGNYLDWTASLVNLDDNSACTSTTWGSPYANYDMKLGTTMAPNQGHP